MVKQNPKKYGIIFLSSYPPRECGLATFTRDLKTACDELLKPTVTTKIIAMDNSEKTLRYPKDVILTIKQDRPEDYTNAARAVNKMSDFQLVNIQHEFGIFGNDYGAKLKYFFEESRKPAITTFHTVLPNPNPKMLDVVKFLAKKSATVIVMTKLSREILMRDYAIDQDKITIIPHGIPTVQFIEKNLKKAPTLATFGLLSRGKGLEYILESLPAVVKKYPNQKYLIIGKTHPNVLKQEGEIYRDSLKKKVKDLKLSKNVRFIDEYLNNSELLKMLKMTDIYLAGSLDPNQAVSGTLSYALGTGCAVISTKFAMAREEVTSEIGLLVDFKKPKEFSTAILKLLDHPKLRAQLSKNAYYRTRHMTWTNVALSYIRSFSRQMPDLANLNKNLPPIKLDHFESLTDKFGMYQFAELHNSNPNFGYTLDDNCRALIAVSEYYLRTKNKNALRLAKIYFAFVKRAYLPKENKFDNYFDKNRKADRKLNEKDSLEDANARAAYALMRISVIKALPEQMRTQAAKMYTPLLANEITSPRAMAFYVKGLCYLPKTAETTRLIKKHCDKLIDLYKRSSSPDWRWFEQSLTYSNSILSSALLLGYRITGIREYFKIGKTSLDFLIGHTFVNKIYIPVGQNGWFQKNGVRAYFDQQPEDTTSMVQTLRTMYSITADIKYRRLMYKAFYWFLGDNILGQFIYDSSTGGSYDGLGQHEVNLNQGAESTVSYLLARLAVYNIN